MNNSKQTTDKNNCIIFGNSDISNFIIESLLNSNNNYNITFLYHQLKFYEKLMDFLCQI